MASQLAYRPNNSSYEMQLRRSRLRRTLLETLDRRELLAADVAGPVFAPGTPQSYIDSMIAQYALGTQGSGEDRGSINLGGSRWSNPASGPSAGQGDSATVTWSIVPDGTIDQGDGNQATNLIAFMDNIYGGGSGPVAQRPWFNIFQKAYDRWSAVSGLTFVYEAKDDGVPIAAGNRGVLGVRGDVRIGGHNIDGNFGVLAYNYYPNGSGNDGFDGEMIIDTNDVFFFNSADGAGGENRGLFNVVMHESGHGIGLGHVIPVDQTKLMEPNISFAFLGAQLDDILGANDLYGDDRENDDTQATAKDLGVLSNGQTKITGGSIDKAADHDWFTFSIPSAGRISLTLEPLGAQYSVGAQNGTASLVNTLTNQNLELELTASNGSVLAYLNATGSGASEQLLNFNLAAAGNYRLRVIGVASAAADPQMYDLTIRMAGLTGANVVTQPPRLLSVAPNVGEIFSFNRTNQLLIGPNELVFRFDGAQFLDPASFNGIKITRSGFDDDFTDGDEVVIAPGYIGFGESERIIVARFASALPDDLYRIEVFGVDVASAGVTAVRNLDGDKLRPRIEGTDRDTIFFNLELGNQIIAVVPQPTSRDASTNVITQARDQIEVYFNEGDKLYASDIATGALPVNPSVVDPNYYRLYADRGTVSNTDDVLYLPTKVEYFVNRNMALLTFASNIDQLDATKDTSYRLRVGTNETQPSVPSVIAQPSDPGSTFSVTGAANLGVFSSITSQQVSEQIVNATAFPLDFPGAPDTPGSREILDDPQGAESHFLSDNPDFNTNLTIQRYNFNKVDPIGVNQLGQPTFSSITPQQEQRAREIFELYGSLLGIQFVESVNQGWTIGTADIDGVSGAIGVAGGGTAIMDAAESWNDEFGANDDPTKFSWFIVAMHEIGHLLGLGHSTELPPGTVLGGFYSNVTLGGEPALLSGNPVEPVFPGATDLVNAKYLHRPDSRDIDMYRFEVAPGKAGEFTATMVAERLPDSSLLDTVLTLYRERADGSHEVVAVNDDYFSEDSFLKLDLQPGVYFLGVSASGNTDYDPTITDSGLGGTSEGAYQLKTTFRPLVASSIIDVKGSALDGDADGAAGGVFNFWFNAAAPNGETAGQRRTLFVDKLTGSTSGDGSRATPYKTINAAFTAAQPGDIVRIVPNGGGDGLVSTAGDNLAFEVGTGGLGNQPLADGSTMNVPKGVTVVVDAGVLFKMGRSTIGVGSSTSSGDRSRANLQVLGTPQQQVYFTSYTDETLGVDTDPLSTAARAGDWGGIIFRNALDRAEGRFDAELQGRFVNYVGFANMQYGGGQVPVDGQNTVITPLHMLAARPTLINNTISSSAFAAVSADPNSFEETTFAAPRYQANVLFTPDYSRTGPEIHGNTLTGNSINGLFVRVETLSGQTTTAQTVAAHWDDRDIVHVIADTLTIAGTPGGPLLETVPPELNVVNISSGGSVAGGNLIPGSNYRYRMTFVDAFGNEGVASAATQAFVVPAGANAIRLGNLPSAGASFVSRKIYRSDNNGTFRLVAELDKSSTVFVDSAAQLGAVLNTATTLNRARLDANLVVDPGMIVKLQGGRIVAGISAQLIAEGQPDLPVIFTSRQDDRFGAGGTFDTNGDAGNSLPAPGDWGGLYFGQAGSGSLDHARVTFGGGVTSVGGTFAGFNAIEIHQSAVRITNSIIENNASGVGGSATPSRNGFGFNESAAIFVRGSQPIIVDNIIRDNTAAAISIDPQSMSGNSVKDPGRATGLADRFAAITENKGPLLRGNALGQNSVNAMVIRGATLTTESVWDDADIVHAVFDQIVVPDLYVFGGLRLQSSPNESLVVKFGPGAGLTSNGRPLDIDDRIGGTLQVVGTPGFPVVLTSIADDSIGAGFDPEGRAQTDTNNNTTSTTPRAGDWRSIRIDEFSNDRNVAIVTELEPAQSTGAGVNSVPSNAQFVGNVAQSEKSSDDNLRLGFTVVGAINNVDDIDIYSFQGTAGTQVWLDIDRTNISLDAVLELVDSDGNIIAQSDNSFDESRGALALFSNPAAIETTQVNAMQTSPTEPRNGGSGQAALGNTFADFYSLNPLDPGMRLVLPGATGSRNTYFVRVRSSNIDSRDPAAVRADLRDPSKLNKGKTEGQYQLQIRLRQMDEFAGSSISYADVRYATSGIEVLGGPSHSPLIGEAVELASNNNTLANALNLGNLLNTERAALSVAGDLNSAQDIDWYRFDVNQDSIQSSGLVQHLSTIIDVDYADGLGRANTSLWLFYDDQNGIGGGTNTGIRLINFGTDSNIADDFGAPLNGSDTDDLSRGSAGVLDAFIGSSALPSGTYYLAITSNEQISSYLSQFYSPGAGGNPLVRVEPINSVTRIVEDRFGGSVTVPALSVGFSGNANQVEYTLADVPLLISQQGPSADTSRLITVSAMTGAQTSLVSQFPFVEDAAIRGDGKLHGARSPQTGVINDANSGGILEIDTAGNGATAARTGGSGIQTFELDFTQNPPTVANALTPGTGGARQGVGMEFFGLAYPQVGNTQFLYGVGSRGNGATSFQTFTGITDATNYVYKLDPTSLAATSAPQSDRQNNARISGAGTQIVERGYIDTSIDVSPNTTYQTIGMAAATPSNGLPALLSGNNVSIQTPSGVTNFQWNASLSPPSASLVADTSPQTSAFQFGLAAPNNFFQDTMSFQLTGSLGTKDFEIDTGRVLVNNYSTLTAPQTWDGSTFTVQDSRGNSVTFEFDSNNTLIGATNSRITYDATNSTQQSVSQSIVNAINSPTAASVRNAAGVQSGVPWSASAFILPGTNRISLVNDYAVTLQTNFPPNVTSNFLSLTQLNMAFPALGGGQSYDGSTFSITDRDGDRVNFEFDINNNVTPGNVPVTYTSSSNQIFLTQALDAAINNLTPSIRAGLAGTWDVVSTYTTGSPILALRGDMFVSLKPSTATVITPLAQTPEYGVAGQASFDQGDVLTNNFDPLLAHDGSTITVQDKNGNTAIFEFDDPTDLNFPGVGSTGGVPHIAIVYNPAVDTRAAISQRIAVAISNPTPASVSPGALPWTVGAHLDGPYDRIRFTGDASVTVNTRPAYLIFDNLFPALVTPQTYDGSTFTITDVTGDLITFEFEDSTLANGTTPGNSVVNYDPAAPQNALTIAVLNAINAPDPAVLGGLTGTWDVAAQIPTGTNRVLLFGAQSMLLAAPGANSVNPLSSSTIVSPIHPTVLFNVPPQSGKINVPIEEFYTNTDDNNFLPTPSTPGAMDELLLAINASGIGVNATASLAPSTRLTLTGLVSADFTRISPITFTTPSGGANTIPFGYGDSALTLNNALLAAIRTVEPLAQLVEGGNRVWLPARSSFLRTPTNDRLDRPPANAELSKPQFGYVTGIAFAGSTMYGVSENGDLYRVGGTTFQPNSTNNNGDFIDTIFNTATGNRVNFVGLTSGPRNVEGGSLANILFGIDASGVLYAFDTQGRPASVFDNAAWFIQTQASNPSGLAFSTLDVNLWHESNNRNADPGHGVNVAFDGSRRSQQNGGRSLYFGFENPTGNFKQVGNWTGVNDPGAGFPGYDPLIYNSYDFPTGTSGSIVSNTLDLSDYSPADKPTLYFNYYLQTENANANNPGDTNYMKDALRVFIAGSDGVWQLLGSNNSDFDATRNVGQRDEMDYPFEVDPNNALSRQVSELYDAGVNGAPDSWRQARVDLSRFAGEDIVRIRFDFSTSGTMDVGTTGGVELVAVSGDKIRERQTFTISGTTFEFDLGLVLQVPSGARLTAGQQFDVDGVRYTFSTTSNVGQNVQFSVNDSADQIAARIAAKIQAQGLSAFIDPSTPSRISVIDAVVTNPFRTATLPANFFSDTPGVTAGREPVLIHSAMTANEVRDAMRTSIARRFNAVGQESNISVVRFHEQSIFLFNKTVTLPAVGSPFRPPLGLSTSLQGDEYGESNSGVTNTVGRGAQQGQNNRFEGVYIDDIIIGFAERGEMVTYQNNDTASITTFVNNPRHEPTPGYEEIETGTYQIEIRRGATYGTGGPTFPSFAAYTSFDTNDRHAQQVALIAPRGAQVTDGQTFPLSDGIDTVTYEYDDTTITSGVGVGVAQGNIRIAFTSLDTPETIALRIRDAINSPQSRAVLDIVAGLSDGTATGTTNLSKTTGSRVVNIHGTVASNNAGGASFPGTQQFTVSGTNQPGFVLFGVDSSKPTEIGDSNRLRDQGQILIQNNIVRDSSNYGIVVDAGARINGALIPLAGALPHPGSVRNLVQFNQEGLIPGPVLINNLIYAGAVGGILFSGDNRTATTTQAPTPFGRIVNNTIVGTNGAGIGINVTDNASPTLLNNIVASLATGIRIDGTSATTVVGATTYQSNGQNSTGSLGTDAQLLAPTEALFVNAAGRNYYLAAGTRAIDSSIDSLNDRQAMTTVRDPLGIAVSPILAPDVDLTGQLRVDDPNISNPNGTGGNPFKDRGAYDRSDFFGPIAIIQQPLDNDPDKIDVDRTNTYIQLQSGQFQALDFFSILLFEAEGTGPAANTVTSSAVVLTENGRLLTDGVDYIFGYNPSSRLIRLTPLAGIWRNDSVYEITLNNRDGIRVSAPDGLTLADGDMFNVVAGTNTLIFEFDSDGSVASGSIAIPYLQTYSRYDVAAQMAAAINKAGNGLGAYIQGDRALMVTGATSISNLTTLSVQAIADVAGNQLQPNRISSLTQYTIVMPEVELDFGDAPQAGHFTVTTDSLGERSINASRHAILPVDAPVLKLGNFVDGESDGQPNAAATGDDNATAAVSSTIPGAIVAISGGAVVRTQAATAAINGQHFTLIDPTLQSVTFEFDTDPNPGLVTAGSVRIAVTIGDSANTVAIMLRNAVTQAVLAGQIEGLSAFVSNDVVDLGGSSQFVFDFSAAPSLTRLGQSEFTFTLPITGLADGQVVSVTDTLGRTVLFELEDLSAATAGISVDRVPVAVNLSTASATDVANAFAAAINLEIAARRLSLAPVVVTGRTLLIAGDDEDGVSFGGLFNANSKPVPVTVNTQGSGILDVWFDWNGDGDFSDAGEHSISNMPVVSGPTKLLFTTPAIAQTTAIAFQNANPGQRFFVANRYRVSTNGTPLIGGVGIGGEVEDYMVEIVVGTPPIAVDDQYALLEDQSLSVPATGILTNDVDPDHTSSQLRVVDEDPTTPVIDPVKNVDHGVLTLRADGSFDYVPSRDYYGSDTFVYNATDPRLLSQFPATVTITVHPVNDAPTAFDDQLTIFEDESITRSGSTFTLNDFKGTFGQASQINELGQNLTVVGAVITHPDPLISGGSVSLVGNVLTFTPAAHYNSQIDGPITLVLTIQDDGQSADPLNGYALKPDFLTDTSTLTIHVLPLNDSPNFVIPAIVNVDEDAGLQIINPFATNIVPGASRATDEATGPGTAPENQTVSFATRALNPSLFASGPSIDANGVLTYQLKPDVTSQSPFPLQILVEVIAIDTGAGGSVLTNSFDASQVLAGSGNTYDGTTLTVTDIHGNVVVFEFDDLATAGVGSTGGFPHVAIPYSPAVDTQDSISQKLVAAISNPPTASIKLSGTNAWAAGAFVDAVTKEIRLTSETSAIIKIGASLSPISARQANTSVPRTFTIVPAAINDAPVFDFKDNPIVLLEDQGPILRTDFVINAKPGPATALDELLSQGLTLTVAAVDPSAFLTQPTVTFDALTGTGTLTFQTNPDVNNATGHDLRIIVTLKDTGGVNRAGDVDTTINTLTISVTPVNDAPIFTLPTTTITVLEDNESFTGVTPTTFVGFATNANGTGFPVQGPVTAIDETTLPATKQSLTFTTVSVSNPGLFTQLPTMTATGDLQFTTAIDKNGTAIVVVRLNDNGPGAETGNNDVNQAVLDRTFTINITPVNDAPEFTIPLTVNSVEDQGLVQIPNFATSLRPGPTTAADESGQEFTVTVQAIDPSKFTILPAIAADGTLTFQTAPNVNSNNANLNVRVFLTDNGASGPAPNSNTSVTKTFTILTQAINDAPSFQLSVSEVSVIEDVEQFLGTSISTFANLATAIVPGPASATDEAGQLLNFEVVSVSAPELFSIAPAVSPLGELSFKTAQNKNGKALVVVRLVDDGLGTPPPNVRNSSLQTFTISITPINDAPEFQLPSVISIDEDAGLISRNGFATNVRRGPIGTDDENSQLINFEVFAVDPSSFTVQPSIAPDGTLVFQIAPNVNTSNANLAVRASLIDNGASSPIPNSNASVTQTFTILVNPVNDPPIADSFTVTGSEDAPITILAADVLVGDRPGPTADENNQTLTMTQIERTSLNGGIITPVMNGNEIVSFTYAPPANLVGTDTFLYVITDNGSPARSGSGTITIALAGINDAPQFAKGPNQVVPEDAPLITVNNWATNILAGPPAASDEHATQTVSFTTSTNNQALFEVQPSINASGTLTFKPSKDANGTAVVTVIAVDNGSNVAPNVNTSVPQTFTITVNPVNDAPAFSAGGNIAVAEDSGPFAQAWATSIAPAQGLLNTPPTANDEIPQIVDFSVATDHPELFSVQPTITSSGQLLFTPARDAHGIALMTVIAVDRGANGGLDVNSSAPATFTLTISAVNDAPKAVGDNYSTNENQILTVAASPSGLLANDEDVDLPGDQLFAVAQTTTSNLGAVVVVSADGSISYDPSNVISIQQLTTGQSVLDSFTYQIRDLAGLVSGPATVTINVAGIDDPPVARDDNYNLGVGQTRLLNVLSNDFDVDSPIDPRTIVITTIPIFGTVKVNQTGVIEYTAGAGFRGIDTLGYTVKDSAGHVSNEAIVTITVNNPPVAAGDTTFTFKNESVDIHVLDNDSDPDGQLDVNSVQVVVLPTPSGTTQVLAGGVIRFTPATNFFGDVQFSYVVSDDVGTTSNVADVLVRVQRSKFQNPKGSLDVNGDGFVSPIDALIIINYLNAGGSSDLTNSGRTTPPYLDPSGDESASPLDALLIINFLNQSSVQGGEGEAPMGGEELVMTVTPQQIIQAVGPQIVREMRAALDETASTVYDEFALDSKSSSIGVAQFADHSNDLALEHALYCDLDDSQPFTDEEAVDAFFNDIGPKLPK